MSIGATIKKLRRERDMTQEQLAEFLGITANAVSQWECDRTAPDISQLPVLANIFRVSADVLLGIDVETKDDSIKEICDKSDDLWCNGQREQAENVCREGLVQFPDAYILMERLACYLSSSRERAAKEESITLFERIRAGTKDEQAKNYAMGKLCGLYMAVGKSEMAKQIAESMPSFIYTRQECLLMTLRGGEWAESLREQITICFKDMIVRLKNLLMLGNDTHPLFSNEERLLLWQKMINLIELFYEDGDYSFDEQFLIRAYYCRAGLYMKYEQIESALCELEKMLVHIKSYDINCNGIVGGIVTLPLDKQPTSLLVRPWKETVGHTTLCVGFTSTENAAMEYLKKLSDSKFDAIRNHPRFVAVVEELKKTAHE